MAERVGPGTPFIRLKLNTCEPMDLAEFVGAFTAISSQFEQYVRTGQVDADPDATLYVYDVRDGCIVADLVP